MGEDVYRDRFSVFIQFYRVVGFLLREGIFFVLSLVRYAFKCYLYVFCVLWYVLLVHFNKYAFFAYKKRKDPNTLELLKRSHTLASLTRITNEKEEDLSLQFWLKWI